MPPSKLFKTWATLAKAYGTHVTRLASDCQVVLEQLQKDISSLRTTLDNAKARIAIDKAELVAAQNTDDVRNALKLIDRIFPVVFTPAAIARAISGEGDIIDELGIVGESYFKAVENSIKAGEVVFLVHKLEKIIATVESTSLQLENTVSVLTGVHGSMEKIGNVWTNDTTSMDIAMNNYSAWRNANLLTLELLETLSSRWGDYRKAADQYANSVFGLKFPNTVNRLALAISGVAEKDLKLATFGTPSDTDSPALKKFYELVNDPKLRTLMAPTTVEDRLEKSKLLLARALDDSLLVESLTAPSITFSINRNALIDVANSYEQAADLLQSVSSSDANRLRDLSSRISTIAIPSIDDSVVYYKDFAQRVIEFVSQPISGESLRAFLSQYLFDTLVGLTKSDGAQQELLTLKNEAALVNNRMVQLKNELQLQLRDAEALYAAHKAELDYYLSLVWIPILGPIIAALYLLISDDIEQMDSLNSKISSIRSAISKVDFVKNIEQVALEVIQELTASWSDLVQKAANLQAFLTVIESTPGLIITLKPQILASWEYLVAELQKWE
ncbi:hypothetical protein GYMLUDRAFT_75521 [Collybiopsis luxurians FD-317 M1]|uniref:Uncharacterized protein n=1 Tax=Collybiopsis luxurians FD-317 M1 TaxID=944289 RepID=A0A0D0CH85_9AGAR|nr:hypothetical protein GYMLUDRAFT_75521 [Collybiopsis luxurians FD-317 M1]